MRKYFTTTKYKERQFRTHKKRNKRKTNKYIINLRIKKKVQQLEKSHTYHTHAHIKNIKKHHAVEIPAPKLFSLVENIEEMLEFFDEIYFNIVKKRKRIFLDFEKVEKLTPDALLYLLSIMEYYINVHKCELIGGNYPKKQEILDLFIESGFTKYVETRSKRSKTGNDILSIESNELVQGAIAKKVVDFAKEKLGTKAERHSKSLYATLIECMANAKNHAYTNSHSSLASRWWLMAMHDVNENKIRFVFLDNGAGIPNTIRKKFKEKVSTFVGVNADPQLILSSLDGGFRTRTEKGWRGKGLPKIYEFLKLQRIDNLSVISSKGYVLAKNRDILQFNRKFHGTLLAWDIV